MRAYLLAAVAIAVAGCASVEPARQATQVATAEGAAVQSKEAITQEEKVAAYNEQQADDQDRVVCRTFMPTGSHRKKTVCRTVSEIEQERESAQDVMRQVQKGAVRSTN